MKKFMRIALVFALAGAALVGCTKDYSGDISDLNKEVSAIQSTLTSLQTSIQGAQSAADAAAATANTALSTAKAAATADDLKAVQTALAAAATSAELTKVDAKYAAYIPAIEAAAKAADLEALETAIKAAIAATDVKVADLEKAFEAYAKKADLDEAVKKLGELETNYIALEARVAKLEAAEKEIRDLIDANAKGIKANAKDIEDLQKLVEELTAQVEGNFSVAAIEKQTATYVWAKWAPETSKDGIKRYNKLVAAFPELADIKKDDTIEMLDNIDFIVNPSSVALDDTYKFYLLGEDGKDSGVVLGNPAKGFATKAGLNVWNVEVQKPAYNKDGKTAKNVENLALVVENANGVYAQTGFDYSVTAHVDRGSIFQLAKHETPIPVKYKGKEFKNNTIDLADVALATEDITHYEGWPFFWWTVVDNYSAPVYNNYYIIEASDEAEIEKFGVSVDGTKVTIENGPEAGYTGDRTIEFAVTAIGVNGKTDATTFTLELLNAPIETTTDLAAQEITLGYKDGSYNVPVKYNVADFEFSALEWKTAFSALKSVTNVTLKHNDTKTNASLIFFDALGEKVTVSGTTPDSKYSTIKAIGFEVNSQTTAPGTYEVVITDENVFCGKGELNISNPETCPVKLIEALCDEDGVLQIVGEVEDGHITYDLANAFVTSAEYDILSSSFVDVDKENDEDTWVENKTTFKIPVASSTVNKLYTTRNFSVNFAWFKNAENKGSFEFKAEAVSPIYVEGGKDVIEVTAPTLYIKGDETKGEPSSKKLSEIVSTGLYVAGDNVGKTYKIFNTWAKTKEIKKEEPAVYEYYVLNGTKYEAIYKSGEHDNCTQNSIYNALGDVVTSGSKYVLTEDGETIKFGNLTLDYINFLNPEIKVSDRETLLQKAAQEGAAPLYLTNAIFMKFMNEWAKYYDINGKAKTKDVKIHTSYIDGKFGDTDCTLYTCYEDEWDSYVNGGNVLWADGGENDDKLTRWKNGDENKSVVDAFFAEFNTLFRKLKEAGKPAVYDWKNNSDAAPEITSVTFGFVNKEYADEFVTVTSESYSPSVNAIPSISANPDARLAGLKAVELDAYIKITDNRNMVMTLPFKVKVAPSTK